MKVVHLEEIAAGDANYGFDPGGTLRPGAHVSNTSTNVFDRKLRFLAFVFLLAVFLLCRMLFPVPGRAACGRSAGLSVLSTRAGC